MLTKLREIRFQIVSIYSKFEAYLVPAGKFILAMVVFCVINSEFGFMTKIAKFPIALILGLFCSFMPMNMIVVIAALLTLAHAYSLSMICAGVLAVVYVIMFLLYFKFSPKDAFAVVLTPICFVLRIPYVIPMAFGLVGKPGSAVSVGCGVLTFYVLEYLKKAAEAFEKAEEDDILTQVKTILGGLINNKEMIVCAAAFAATVLVVYFVRRMSIKYAWTIAMVVGALCDILIILVGDIMFTTNISVVGLLFGTLLGCAVVKVIQFFVFDLDYSKTEKVQFEDDDYYYYVKAVPKIKVSGEKSISSRERTRRSEVGARPRRTAEELTNERAERSGLRERQRRSEEERAQRAEQENRMRAQREAEENLQNGNTEKIELNQANKMARANDEARRAEIARRREAQRRREQRLYRQASEEVTERNERVKEETIIRQEENDDLGLQRRMEYQRRKLEERIGNSADE